MHILGLLLLLVTVWGCAPQKTFPPSAPQSYREMPSSVSSDEDVIPIRPSQTPISRPLIVIDPGHGGEDFGTQSNSKPRYQEKHLNLATAQMLRTYLNQMGYATMMTRTKDTFISLDKRAQFANERKPALFISVHYNSAPSPDAEGIEVFYYRSDKNPERSKKSKELAQEVLDKIIPTCQAKSRGVKHGNFAVIRSTEMPAILVEGGFLTNDEEMQRIKDPSYLKKLAWSMAQGIQSYLRP